MVTSLAVNKKKFQCLVWVLPLLHQAVECISVRFVEVESVSLSGSIQKKRYKNDTEKFPFYKCDLPDAGRYVVYCVYLLCMMYVCVPRVVCSLY